MQFTQCPVSVREIEELMMMIQAPPSTKKKGCEDVAMCVRGEGIFLVQRFVCLFHVKIDVCGGGARVVCLSTPWMHWMGVCL